MGQKASKMDNDKHIIQIVDVTHKKGNVSKESEIIYVQLSELTNYPNASWHFLNVELRNI